MRSLLSLFLVFLLIGSVTCQYMIDSDEWDLMAGEEEQFGGQHVQEQGYLGKESESSNKNAPLQARVLPMLRVNTPLQVLPTQELQPELHTQKTVQPVIQTRTIYQPIVRQRILEQPILRTHMKKQPIHRWIETQPVVQPKIIQNTRVIKQISEQPLIVPKVIEKTHIQQEFQAKPRTLPTITNQPQFESTPVQTQKQHLGSRPAINTNPQLMRSVGVNENQMQLEGGKE